jgi:hypothetical protein
MRKLKIAVRGSAPIEFGYGGRCGDMVEPGVIISTVWDFSTFPERVYGGCITLEEAMQIRDFLDSCINKKQESA